MFHVEKMCYLKSNVPQLVKMSHSFYDNIACYSFFKIELHSPFHRIQIKSFNHVHPFQEDSLLLTTKFLGVPGTLLIDLTMKSLRGFEPVNTGLVIGKHLIISLLFHSKKVVYKGFKI